MAIVAKQFATGSPHTVATVASKFGFRVCFTQGLHQMGSMQIAACLSSY